MAGSWLEMDTPLDRPISKMIARMGAGVNWPERESLLLYSRLSRSYPGPNQRDLAGTPQPPERRPDVGLALLVQDRLVFDPEDEAV